MTYEELAKIIVKFQSSNILVIGDVMIDVYVRGDVHRISPEAPVPVVLQHSEDSMLGGAGNVAESVRALGGGVALMGVVGKDIHAKEVVKLCRAHGVAPLLIEDDARPTSVKMRIVSRGHQLLRVDRESAENISRTIEKELIRAIAKLGAYDLVIVSDYHKGVMTKLVMQALIKKFGKKAIIADIKPENGSLYKGILAITPNIKESFEMTGMYANTEKNAERVLRKLGKKFESSIILTRGEYGMSIYDDASRIVSHIQAKARHVFDVTGAGDTVIAAFALMYVGGAGIIDSAHVANLAGGIVVEKEGTATVSRKELLEYLEYDKKR